MRIDPHSYTDDSQPTVHELDWKVRIDFDRRVLRARVALRFTEPARLPGWLDLDTRDLALQKITDSGGKLLKYSLAAPEEVFGQKLRIDIPAGTESVAIEYETSPSASGLQWLTPAQTAGGMQPFLFSQCQAIHARSLVPIQDTPKIRIREGAHVL